MPGNTLEKLTIIPYDEKGKSIVGSPFVAMYNPSTLSTQHSQELADTPNSSNAGNGVQTKQKENGTLTVELFIDGTNASPSEGSLSITDLKKFTSDQATVGVSDLVNNAANNNNKVQ